MPATVLVLVVAFVTWLAGEAAERLTPSEPTVWDGPALAVLTLIVLAAPVTIITDAARRVLRDELPDDDMPEVIEDAMR